MYHAFAQRIHQLPIAAYGAIDLGTNACRLLIGQSRLNAVNNTLPQRAYFTFERLETFSRIVRLGEIFQQQNILSADAMKRALTALEMCQQRMKNYHIIDMRCVATAACRQAINATEFVTMVHQKLGLNLEIISAREEAMLAVTGCIDVMDFNCSHALIFDIGGGSTEIIWIKLRPESLFFKMIDWISLPYGIMTSRHTATHRLKKRIAYYVRKFARRNQIPHAESNSMTVNSAQHDHRIQLIGASGTVTTLSAIAQNLSSYHPLRVHNTQLTHQDIKNVTRKLWNMTPAERASHPCIGPTRKDFMMKGVAIFEALYSVFPFPEVLVADRGVRDGLLASLTHPHRRSS